MIVWVSFPDENLNLLVQSFWQWFIGPRVIQLHQPDVKSLEQHLLHIHIFIQKEHIIDWTHNEGEERDSEELHDHRENVLLPSVPIDIAVAHCCQCDHDPVQRSDIFSQITVL